MWTPVKVGRKTPLQATHTFGQVLGCNTATWTIAKIEILGAQIVIGRLMSSAEQIQLWYKVSKGQLVRASWNENLESQTKLSCRQETCLKHRVLLSVHKWWEWLDRSKPQFESWKKAPQKKKDFVAAAVNVASSDIKYPYAQYIHFLWCLYSILAEWYHLLPLLYPLRIWAELTIALNSFLIQT